VKKKSKNLTALVNGIRCHNQGKYIWIHLNIGAIRLGSDQGQ